MAIHTATILIPAKAARVFNVLTNPELVPLWQYGKKVTTSWKPGDPIRFSVQSEDKLLEQWGTILEVRPDELIKYNLFTPKPGLPDIPENYYITTYSMTPQGDRTSVEIIQEDNRSNTFEPVSLLPVLAGLKRVVEELDQGEIEA